MVELETREQINDKQNSLQAMIQLIRPRQWVKSSFVFVGLLFSHQAVFSKGVLAAVAFCFVSSAVYVFNDLMDREHDRNHPVKCQRPLASKRVTLPVAGLISGGLLFGGLLVGLWVSRVALGILLVYIIQNFAYSKGLKQIVIIDVFLIASGFMLRILMGTWGVGIIPSNWLILCGVMIALFMGFGKRWAELNELASGAPLYRPVLKHYTSALLNQFVGITAGGVILTYSLYTLDAETIALHQTSNLIYTVPFVIYGVFRYLYLIQAGGAGEPSKLVTKDGHLIAVVLLWLLSVLWILKFGNLLSFGGF